ncbi:hypothetical protein NIES2130_12595 [Scytonema sp. HK-05]|nr:hypothetical protein NIES2130_12595 [Scytonema sp. HK-05]
MSAAVRNHAIKAKLGRALSLTALCLGYFMVLLDTTILNVALPTIEHKMGGALHGLQWVVNGYALVFASLLLSGGVLGDRLGAKRVYLAGLAVFTIASLLCGLAPTLDVLITARVIQGFGAAMMVPGSLSLIRQAYSDPQDRARAVGIWAGVAAIGFASGPLIGGYLVEILGWRSIFFINIPPGILAVALTRRFVPKMVPNRQQGFNLGGQILAIVALCALTYALIESGRSGWGAPPIIVALLIFVVAAALFIVVEYWSYSPMLPLQLFAKPSFSVANTVGLFFSFGLYGQIFILSLFLQNVRGYSATAAGLAFLPLSVASAVTPPLSGWLTGRIGPQLPMIIGLASSGVGVLVLVSIGTSTSYTILVIGFVLLGIGAGVTVPAMTATILWSVPKEQSGIASAVLNSSRQVGGVLGVALLGSLVSQHSFTTGMYIGQIIVAVIFLFSCILTFLYVPRRMLHHS